MYNRTMKKALVLLALAAATTSLTHNRLPVAGLIAQDPSELKCLAVTVYGEARGESEKGQIAVAYTVKNRAKNKSVCNVALAPKQYSIFNNNPELVAAAKSEHIQPRQKNQIDQRSWERAMRVATVVMHGLVPDPTNGATHYLAPALMKIKRYKYPKWSKQYTLVSTIDGHKFYKMTKNG